MTFIYRIPPLVRFAVAIALFYTLLFSVARIVFWLAFDNAGDPFAGTELWQALYIGMKFDLRVALLTVLPLLLLGWIRYIHPIETDLGMKLWRAYLLLATLSLSLFYLLDFGHYAYLHTRVDNSVLRFFADPLISLDMVWQSYPVVWGALLLTLAMLTINWGLNRLIDHFLHVHYIAFFGWRKVLMVTATFFVVLFGLYGKISYYPLRWSDAFFSTHSFASSVATNPAVYFYYTYHNGGLPFDTEATRDYYPLLADYLGIDKPDADKLNFARKVTPTGHPNKPYNIVVVILESFAAYKSGLSGNPLHPTPNFDEVARNGLYYKNFYTPVTGTARSVFCALTGLPDVQLGNTTSSRNPRVVDQHMLMNDFDGYEKYYFLGGSASWGNIRGLLGNNISGLHLYEEGSYASPRVDVWGLSDLDLFKEAHKVLQHEKKPFFAVIQTSGNHRPYTIPENNEGFELKHASQEKLEKYGFESEEEFNSYRFMDHSIGYFMQQVKDAGYFDNTVFAFFGDHGIAGNAGIHTYKADTQLGLGKNRVPFVIYSPALIPEGKVINTVASETDVMTSLASLTGHQHINTTLGRDLFNPAFDRDRNAFIISPSANTTIGVVNKDYYYYMPITAKQGALHRLDSKEPRQDVSSEQPQQAEKMRELTRALYEAARYITNNNPKPRRDSTQP